MQCEESGPINTGPLVGTRGTYRLAPSSQHLSPFRVSAPVADTRSTEQEWRDSLLCAAAKPLLAELRRTAEESDFIVAISDGGGKLLWTHASRYMTRRAEDLNFVPGGLWNEASVGTNALDLALRTVKPAKVFSAEHFMQTVHDWVCYSAPIRDPGSGLPLGVLDFSSTWTNSNALGLMTATALARLLEQRVVELSGAKFLVPADALHSPALELELCGRSLVRFEGTALKLSPRQTEILALLALYPAGLGLETLHAHLYGDAPVSLSTLKAEISLLRSMLKGEITSRPYRLTLDYRFDALEVQRHLEGGDVCGALERYCGPLLGASEAPHLCDWRTFLEEAVRLSVLQTGSSELLWRYSLRQPEDFEALLALAASLSANDARMPVVQARLQLLRSEPGFL